MKPILTTAFFLLSFCSFSQGKLEISTGASIRVTNNGHIVLTQSNLVNNGSLQIASGNGTLKFTGSSNVSFSGTGTTSVDQLDLALSGTNNLSLQKNISVLSSLIFTGGLLNLNNSVIDLGTTGSLNNESESSRAYTTGTGYIQSTAALNMPSSTNPGNLGAILTSSANLGATVVRRGHQSQINSYGNGNTILRYFDILPANNSSLNASLRFAYFDAELNSLDENSLVFWKSDNNINWLNLGFNTRNTITNYVEKTGINSFSRWTLSSPINPLQVQFALVNSSCVNGYNVINWNTAGAINIKNYVIEESLDGISWQEAGTVLPSYNDSYSFSVPSPAFTFFRVRANSFTGSETYSNIVKGKCDLKERFTVGPTPAKDKLLITITIANATRANLLLYDSKGALLKVQPATLLTGNNVIEMDVSRFPAAVYSLQLQWNNETRVKRVIKF